MRGKARWLATSVAVGAALLVAGWVAVRAEGQPAELRVRYGLLHAHTSFSDGSGTPEDAFAAAKAAGLDFFAVTEHNHGDAEDGAKDRTDGVLIATNKALYEAAGTVSYTGSNGASREALSVIAAAQAATSSEFVALYGQEFSTISSGNHVNVFGVPRVLELPNGNFKALYEHLSTLASGGTPPLVQLNHPDVHADLFSRSSRPAEQRKTHNDYGIDDADYGPEFASLVASTDRFVGLIELLSGPAMARKRRENYRYDSLEDDYYFYLTQGFHVSPSAGQDNHYPTWGTVTDARTGVLTAELSERALYDAMHENRTFVTEDKNLSVQLKIGGTSMGSVLELASDAPLPLEVVVADADEPDASYRVELVYGLVEPARRERVEEMRARDNILTHAEQTGDGSIALTGFAASGSAEFFYVRVMQLDDGNRAWTAPIWINHPRDGVQSGAPPTFVWTRSSSSKVYHLLGCTAAAQIKPENRVEGATAPAGRTLHACSVKDTDEDQH